MTAFGRIDVLVTNAGYGMAGVLEETSDQRSGTWSMSSFFRDDHDQAGAAIMRTQGTGYISYRLRCGLVGAPGWSVYSATKAGLAAFRKSSRWISRIRHPGYRRRAIRFRTGFLTEGSLALVDSQIGGYEAVKQARSDTLP